ncbi:MAG TPA: cysteine desulfurase-like protein [Gaiellaceae bacterium]|nr:cysteine desulfurase-like protein [Gaiellaceae bacterium]
MRARFSALDQPLAFFDGPGGTQVPDSVIEAIADYLRESNANIGAPYGTSRRTDALVERSHEAAAEFLNATPEEVAFGPNMSTLNFSLTRAAARGWQAGDEIVCTMLDHDANVSPWLELAHDLGLVVRFVEIDAECRLDLDHLRSLLNERTRVVAYPFASNAVGTITPAAEIAALAHEAGALAWVDAVHYGPHGPIDVQAVDADVLICSPYKYYGPHMGLAFGKRELLESWRPYKVRPASNDPVGRRFETGTSQHELLAGFVACIEHMEWAGWDFILDHEQTLGQRFLDGLPETCELYGVPTMDRRVSTFAFNVAGHESQDVAERLGDAGYAVWAGDYYAVEVMKRLALPGGAVRVGIVHYNTADEVDGLLDALRAL